MCERGREKGGGWGKAPNTPLVPQQKVIHVAFRGTNLEMFS